MFLFALKRHCPQCHPDSCSSVRQGCLSPLAQASHVTPPAGEADAAGSRVVKRSGSTPLPVGNGPSCRYDLRNFLHDFREFTFCERSHRGGFGVALRSDGEGGGGGHLVARTFRHSDDGININKALGTICITPSITPIGLDSP